MTTEQKPADEETRSDGPSNSSNEPSQTPPPTPAPTPPSEPAENDESVNHPAEPVGTGDVAATAPPTESPAAPARKILIGTQKDAGASSVVKPKAVEKAVITPVTVGDVAATNQPPVEAPPQVHSTAGLGEDLESEIEQALGSVSMDQLMAGEDLASELEVDSRIKATVTRIHNDDVFVTLKGRFEGLVSLRQFKKPPELGAMMDVVVQRYNADDGIYEVSVPGASVAVADWSDLNEGNLIEVKITGSNTGGLECVVNGIRGFIPASQIEIFRVDNFGDYVNKKLQCLVTEVNPKRKKLVLSHRAIAEREKEENRKALLETIEVGQVYDGTVVRLLDFGAFVDIGGIEGLVHVSKISWDRVGHPSDVLKEGEKVRVKVDKVNAASGKISLSHRDTMEHPWHNIDQKFQANSTVKGTVTRLAQFGAFVKLEPGIEGLIHISELAHHRVMAVKNIVKEGDEVEVKVLSVDPDSQKIGLSLKATQEPPKPKAGERKTEEELDEPLRESAVKAHQAPLKGGRDKGSGGEQFGLKW